MYVFISLFIDSLTNYLNPCVGFRGYIHIYIYIYLRAAASAADPESLRGDYPRKAAGVESSQG